MGREAFEHSQTAEESIQYLAISMFSSLYFLEKISQLYALNHRVSGSPRGDRVSVTKM